MTMIDLPGFADPVADAQACFRAVLAAMSQPGTLHRLARPVAAPPPLGAAAAAVLLTLVDAETRLAVTPDFAAAADWITFHCGTPTGSDLTRAGFILAATLPALDHLDAGSDECPEDSATVILQLAALGRGQRFVLAGPGLERPTAFAASGLPADFTAIWAANHARYPRGIDLILCAGDTLAALPRSLSVAEG